MNLWNRLTALFLPSRRLANTEHGDQQQRGGLLGGQQWVVGRGECQYRREDLRALPANKRLQAGRLAATRLCPAPEAHTCTAWTGGIAHFWFWLKPDITRLAKAPRWLPESLLLPPPPTGVGVRLLQLSHGYEAQHWQEGVLASSQWWAQLPNEDEWLRFARTLGQEAIAFQTPPPPTKLAWAARPWGQVPWLQRLSGAINENTVWLLLALALCIGLGWQLASLHRWQKAGAQLAAQVEAARTSVAPLLAAREQAEQAQQELSRLQQLRGQGSDYGLVAALSAHLPEGSQLLTWHREAEKLQVALNSPETDPRAFVEAFEDEPRLADVTVTPVNTTTMQLAFVLPVSAEKTVAAAQPEAADNGQ